MSTACVKHFQKASTKLRAMCRLLMRRVALPSAKKLVYTLCLKSQIRYSAGLPTALFRQIYGLRRCFPADLIYAPRTWGAVANPASVTSHNSKSGNTCTPLPISMMPLRL